MELLQEEADRLRLMPKELESATPIDISTVGEGLVLPVVSSDQKEKFLIDIWQASIKLSKWRYQERTHRVIPLMRLELDSSPHLNRNISDEDQNKVMQNYGWPYIPRLDGNHVHVYIEGYGDRWAFPLSIFPSIEQVVNSSSSSYTAIISAFLRECNIKQPIQFVQQLKAL